MLLTFPPPHARHSGQQRVAVGPRRTGGRTAASGLSSPTQDHNPLDGLADHGQRHRTLPGVALTEPDYSAGLNTAKLFRSPIIYALLRKELDQQ